jgi:hypothetical protein
LKTIENHVCKREARKSRMETAGCIGLSSGGKVGVYSLLFYRIIGAIGALRESSIL